jgi:hypothetical protein
VRSRRINNTSRRRGGAVTGRWLVLIGAKRTSEAGMRRWDEEMRRGREEPLGEKK